MTGSGDHLTTKTKSEATKASVGRKTSVRVANLIANSADSHAEIATRVGVDKSLVTRWRSGQRKPTEAQLAKLEELYGAPVKPPAPKPPPVADEDHGEEESKVDTDESNTDRLRRFIRDGMRELELDVKLSGVKRAEALKKLVDAQVALDKSTGENALTMTKIAAHPEFQRVVRLITEAIAPHPDVLAKVLEVLRANP